MEEGNCHLAPKAISHGGPRHCEFQEKLEIQTFVNLKIFKVSSDTSNSN